ncbi:MAG: hypothetical protein KIT84_13160 [Labilithrix sp.]|nr:hypothetical protein [Labilithrix sp.]MCW5811965.1 hypothetical protein [Labilithrix sp.]
MRGDRLRDVLSFAVLAGFTSMLAGTSKSKSTSPEPAPSAAALPAETSMTVEKMATQPDVSLAAVSVLARCATEKTHPACRLLKDFEAAPTYTETAATVLWFGESIGIGGAGDTTKEPLFVTLELSPSGLAGAARVLLYDDAAERKDGDALLAAVKQGKTIPTSKAAKLMRTAPPANGPLKLAKTKGRSLAFVETPPKVYVRKSGDRLLVLEYDPDSSLAHDSRSLSAKAWIAEAWLVR